jgi:hypothetical protein
MQNLKNLFWKMKAWKMRKKIRPGLNYFTYFTFVQFSKYTLFFLHNIASLSSLKAEKNNRLKKAEYYFSEFLEKMHFEI